MRAHVCMCFMCYVFMWCVCVFACLPCKYVRVCAFLQGKEYVHIPAVVDASKMYDSHDRNHRTEAYAPLGPATDKPRISIENKTH